MFTVQMGICSEQVLKLQLLLNARVLPKPHLRLDGSFGRGTHWLAWGRALTTPRNGAVTVIYKPHPTVATGSVSGNHVGFLIEETSAHVRLLGGNQSDQVKYSNFQLSSYKVKSYRWPL